MQQYIVITDDDPNSVEPDEIIFKKVFESVKKGLSSTRKVAPSDKVHVPKSLAASPDFFNNVLASCKQDSDLMITFYNKAVRLLFKRLNKHIAQLKRTLSESVYESEFMKMASLVAIWQWVDGGLIAQLLASRYKHSGQQYLPKKSLAKFDECRNLFAYMGTDHKCDTAFSDSFSKVNHFLHVARANIENTLHRVASICNPMEGLSQETLQTIVDVVCSDISKIMDAKFPCYREEYNKQYEAKQLSSFARKLSMKKDELQKIFPALYKKNQTQFLWSIPKFLREAFGISNGMLNRICIKLNYVSDGPTLSFQGEWQSDRPCKGKYHWSWEDAFKVYTGTFNKDCRYHGDGEWAEGDADHFIEQKGIFDNGVFKKGSIQHRKIREFNEKYDTFKQADNFENKTWNGRGKIGCSDGRVFSGDWKNGVFTPTILTYPDNTTFSGQFRSLSESNDFEPWGEGTHSVLGLGEYCGSAQVISSFSEACSDQPSTGRLCFARCPEHSLPVFSSKQYFYKGELRKGKPYGRGTFYISEQMNVKGWWLGRVQVLSDWGEATRKDNARGTLQFPNGDSYQGGLKDGVFHGKGKVTKKNGK